MGLAHFPANHETQAGAGKPFVAGRTDCENRGTATPSGPDNSFKIARSQKSTGASERAVAHVPTGQTGVNRARPFRRRFRMIFRPPRVAIRARKPWFRFLRMLLGLKVGCTRLHLDFSLFGSIPRVEYVRFGGRCQVPDWSKFLASHLFRWESFLLFIGHVGITSTKYRGFHIFHSNLKRNSSPVAQNGGFASARTQSFPIGADWDRLFEA